jgi:hypothetical protein
MTSQTIRAPPSCSKESIVTCPRKYCLIDTCVSDFDSYHPDALNDIEPDPDPEEDAETYPAYRPPKPTSTSELVMCIAGNTTMYFCVLALISVALQLTLYSNLYIVTIILTVGFSISITVAAIAEQLTDRAATPAGR